MSEFCETSETREWYSGSIFVGLQFGTEIHSAGRFMKTRLLPVVVAVVVAVLCFHAIRPPLRVEANPAAGLPLESDLRDGVNQVDEFFDSRWKAQQLEPAEPADELLVLRRLALSLMGTVPSLEEIRQFEQDEEPDRLERWTLRYLQDDRFADYFAERLARCFVGVDNGAFIIFRRDRFVSWLSEQLRENERYDHIVQSLVASEGLWTGDPESNFITAAIANGEIDHNKLAARSVRAFLGQSMDCAQCHDHFFAEWTQTQFEGIAAQFGQAENSAIGINDSSELKFKIPDPEHPEDEEKLREVDPAVPFGDEWLPGEGSPRQKFAVWITHDQNRRFERAIANRVWGLMFGRPFITPVDDMGDPPGEEHADSDKLEDAAMEEAEQDLLDILGQDFRKHGCDLKRMIQVIAASRAYRLQSSHPTPHDEEIEALDAEFAVFPLTRLRPEQVIGSMLQATWVQTIDQNSHLIVRGQRYFGEQNFVQQYGDMGDQELTESTGTIPQALLRMNSDMTREAIKSDGFSAANRVANVCSTNEKVVETAYLICVTRRPTPEEREHFLGLLGKREGDSRETIVEDIFWSLFNSPEFSWNH